MTKVYHMWNTLLNEQINAKCSSVETRNKKSILNDIIYKFCNLKAKIHIILWKV